MEKTVFIELLILWILCMYLVSVNSLNQSVNQNKSKSVELSKKHLYKYGFKIKRKEQIQGVKRIARINDYAKQFSMVKILVEKIFKVLIAAKVKVIQSGYVPGEEFPESQAGLDCKKVLLFSADLKSQQTCRVITDMENRELTRNFKKALGHVLENVAFFGDLLLRCPDITHKLYDKNQEWKVTLEWGLMFSNESGIFDGSDAKLLSLVAQELEIMPREGNYINPYKEQNIKAEQKLKLKEEEREATNKEERKRRKKKKNRKKGPRLGGPSGEL